MINKRNIIPIVCACNEKYAPYAGVMIESIIEHASLTYVYEIYIFYSDLSDTMKYRLMSMEKENIRISLVDARLFSFNNFDVPVMPQWGKETYYRLLIPEFLRKYPKVIYLDVDLVVKKDIATLFLKNLDFYLLGGCLCPCGKSIQHFNNLSLNRFNYINAGVLLINVDLWNKLNMSEKMVSTIKEYASRLVFPDQDLINMLCQEKILYLDQSWNFMTHIIPDKAIPNNEKKDFLYYYENSDKIGIIHYAGKYKPWIDDNSIFCKEWWSYAKKSPFYEQILLQKIDGCPNKIESQSYSIENGMSEKDFLKKYSDWLLDLKTNASCFVPFTKKPFKREEGDVRIFAHYLPQFHTIPENDKNYGKGFTEWRNVASAIPVFIGHCQPKIPYDLGFYNLNDINIMKRQIEIAKAYGVYGFCFYWYWFSGKKLLEKPLYQFLKSDIDFHFHLCWCNESWSKLWDNGDENTVIIKQELKNNDADKFFKDILPFIQDHRYEKVGNKPILLIYKPFYFGEKEMSHFVKQLNKLAIQKGFDGFYFLGATNSGNDFTCLMNMGFSAAIEWPPGFGRDARINYSQYIANRQKIINNLNIFDLHKFVLERRYLYPTTYPLFKCVFPSWDNSPRKLLKGEGRCFLLSDKDYAQWLRDIINYTRENYTLQEQYMYIFSWNEWAEGAVLEPTTRFGYKYLDILKNVLENSRKK